MFVRARRRVREPECALVGCGRYTACAVEGLGYLHRLGLTHGNLRPSNMLVLAVRFVCESAPRILGP